MKNHFSIILILLVSLANAQTEIYFETGKSKLSNKSKTVLDSLLGAIGDKDALKIHGHTDTVGSIEANNILSEKRTNAVKDYLIRKGTSANMETFANGETKPAYKENWQNRRVKIIILKAKGSEDKLIAINPQGLSLEQFNNSDQINLENIQFKPGTAEFYNQAALDELRQLRIILKELNSIKIRIEGHVCCVDDRLLSEMRAKKVLSYLIDNGIDKERLSSVGFSNSKPLVPETSAANNQKNRRVEISIVER